MIFVPEPHALALAFARATYTGSAWLGSLMLLFALRIAGRDRHLTAHPVILLFALPFACVLLAVTNEWHHVFWTSTSAFAGGHWLQGFGAGPG